MGQGLQRHTMTQSIKADRDGAEICDRDVVVVLDAELAPEMSSEQKGGRIGASDKVGKEVELGSKLVETNHRQCSEENVCSRQTNRLTELEREMALLENGGEAARHFAEDDGRQGISGRDASGGTSDNQPDNGNECVICRENIEGEVQVCEL
jgi:hypothetical protein